MSNRPSFIVVGAGSRDILIMGDQGTLHCTDAGIEHFDFLTDKTEAVSFDTEDEMLPSAHGGGDYRLMQAFLRAVRENNPALVTSGPDVSLESHLIVFAAERSRRNGTVETL